MTDYKEFYSGSEEKYCGSCGRYMNDGDKYCTYCGRKRGAGSFDPSEELMQCIYGPMPVKRIHRCGSCGNEWESIEMVDRANYCPKCGKDGVITEEDDDDLW